MKLTRWEVGQSLLKSVDALDECEVDLRLAGYRKLAGVLRECRLTIGDHFNAGGSHSFAVPSHSKRWHVKAKKANRKPGHKVT